MVRWYAMDAKETLYNEGSTMLSAGGTRRISAVPVHSRRSKPNFMRNVKFPFASMCFLGALLLGVSSLCAQTQPPPPSQSTEPKPQNPKPGGQPSSGDVGGAAVDLNKYEIGPEDILFIKTWREPDFTQYAAVRPDGKITIPLVGEVMAGGQTPLQLAKTLTELIGKYINHPDVNVFVQEVRSKKYYIDGEVNRPGPYALVTTTTVLEALSMCGGFKEFANKKNITILRGSKTYRFNYHDVVRGKHLDQNIAVENGDHIIVH